ncbi:GNAT family N-acetyltransferase [Streptomyces beihaiensis]|uniref:GNAT family N-acetyltransferase n=1 Tax=Streptomyces beihaiensis TaxID=2984495 RepID=A0ABT3TZ40_9ACTN|nr:GNAT family N-acetyltransferase [Streptomyces beihaiensis]MCX3061330.1 GNAT family N-acetyltransferase [Streptomyces beihaiensis]
MEYEIRPVRPDEWREVRELRLASLQDPAAPIAFMETYEQALTRPDEFWQARANRSSHGMTALQFVAAARHDGRWLGSVVVLVEEPGAADIFGETVKERQAQLVGVYVRPEARGSGVTRGLFAEATEWALALDGVERVRLFVHEDNERAEKAYRRFGFVPTGHAVANPGEAGKVDREMEFRPDPMGPA